MSTPDPASFLAEGEARLGAGDVDGAIAAFRQAVAADSSSAVAHSKLGIAYAHRKEWDTAASEFSRALQLDPTYAPAYSNMGNVYRERGQLDQAIAHYQKAVSLDPDYSIAHQNLGIAYKEQGRIAEAVREFKTASRLSLRRRGGGGSGGQPHADGAVRPGCLGMVGAVLLGALGGLCR